MRPVGIIIHNNYCIIAQPAYNIHCFFLWKRKLSMKIKSCEIPLDFLAANE